MIKKLINLSIILLLFIITYANAQELSSSAIPLDANLHPYSALVGRTPNGQWVAISLKDLGNNRYGLDLGSVSVAVVGSISTVLYIDKPISIEHPVYTTDVYEFEIAPLQEGTIVLKGTSSNPLYIEGYRSYVEYITWWRPDTTPIDSFGFGFYITNDSTQVPNKFVLGQEVTPIYQPSLIKPIFPIQYWNYKIRIINKSTIHSLKLQIGIITSTRKVPS